MTKIEQEWRDNLKHGDLVIYKPSGFYGTPSIRRVERVTKTQIVIKGIHGKFRKSDGVIVGDSYSFHGPSRINMPREHEVQKIRRDNMALCVMGAIKDKINDLSLDQLNQIQKVLDDAENMPSTPGK